MNPTQPAPAIERFFRHVEADADTGCWNWTAFKQRGYGQFAVEHRHAVRAHRWSYEYFIGAIPEGLHIDHLCRNPSCVNPSHLEPVTAWENLMRAPSTFQARNAAKKECLRGHPFNEENTRINRTGGRVCRVCERVRKSLPPQPRGPKTHCAHGHEFTPENTYVRKGTFGRQRNCLACNRRRTSEYQARKRAAS